MSPFSSASTGCRSSGSSLFSSTVIVVSGCSSGVTGSGASGSGSGMGLGAGSIGAGSGSGDTEGSSGFSGCSGFGSEGLSVLSAGGAGVSVSSEDEGFLFLPSSFSSGVSGVFSELSGSPPCEGGVSWSCPDP